ncbi:MAG TPA: hypothetical protein VLZ83_16255 [Edaphocola sp.]|nr:hypothetical protein [Edaphocola sp.]
MKNKILKIGILIVLGLTLGFGVIWAQTKLNSTKKGETYMNDKQTKSGNIKVDDFINLIQNPLWVKDTRDSSFIPLYSFRFTYAERGLFEDAEGKPKIFTDYMFYNCKDQLEPTMIKDVKSRVKPGDTVFIEQVHFKNPKFKDNYPMPSSSLKLILIQ